MKKEKKKKILPIMALACIGLVGGTLAYFTTSDKIDNVFNTASYEAKIEERFESPDNWTPGTTTEKVVNVTNEGTIPMGVRASYTEKWIDAEGNELPLQTEEGVVAAIINFNDDNTYKKIGNYYYLKKALNPEEVSPSFIKSVTFNENITLSTTRTEVDTDTDENGVNDVKTITYISSENGYNGATYTLEITIETCQRDQIESVWGVLEEDLA